LVTQAGTALACPSGSKYARFPRALRMSLSENVPTRDVVCRHSVH
jgi:hypothetical protein